MPMAALNLDEENNNAGGFAWCDGVFLRALKTGQWVLLDEMNLATQQVRMMWPLLTREYRVLYYVDV